MLLVMLGPTQRLLKVPPRGLDLVHCIAES
jgi:hypothetical protein